MNEKFQVFGFILACIHDILIIVKVDYTDHLYNLEPTKSKQNSIRLNIENIFLVKQKWNILVSWFRTRV